jgi:hypothetical protein
MKALQDWINAPALWYQFWLPRSGWGFWFASGALAAATIAAIF